MIDYIIDILSENGKNNVVFTSGFNTRLKYFNVENEIADVRSATFFAMGKAIMLQRPVILVVPGEFLENAYTGITESWFQKAKLRIVAIYNSYYDIKSAYLDRCLLDTVTIVDDVEKHIEDINLINQKLGPVLINIVQDIFDSSPIQYGNMLNTLREETGNDVEIWSYNADESTITTANTINIMPKYKYGLLSKYMGYIVAKNRNVLLCCTANCILVDSNIFSIRYINANCKIIILDYDDVIKNNHIDQWILSNDMYCFSISRLSKKDIVQLMDTNKATILVVKGVE